MSKVTIQPFMTNTQRIEELTKQFPHCKPHINELESTLDGEPRATELIEYLINEFIGRKEECAKKIINSIKAIKNEEQLDLIPAVKKLSRALYNNKIKIFFSYKLKDEPAATAVVEAMRSASDRLDITYAKDFKTGKDYREKIIRATRNAHWFILLLPDPDEDWDWCLYESGLFRANTFPGDRLVCIHHKDSKIPDQISNFNAVAATKEKLTSFLNELFCKDNPIPGMDRINENAMTASIAEIIAREVSPPSTLKTIPFHDFVSVKVSDDNPLESNEDLNKMRIIDCTQGKIASFGKSEPPNTWEELISNVVTPDNDQWRSELRMAIKAARKKNIPNEINSTFAGCNNKHYRPILHAKTQSVSTGQIRSFSIDFVEDISVVDQESIPQSVSILAAALKLALRFRWEILENKRYHDHVMCEEEADELRMSIDRILIEGISAGLMDKELLKSQFEKEEDKSRIDEMFEQWFKVFNNEGTGILDDALREKNALAASKILKELAPLNKEFLKMVSHRFTEVLA